MIFNSIPDLSELLKDYIKKQVSIDDAIKKFIKPGSRIFIDSGCAEPKDLTKKLIDIVTQLHDFDGVDKPIAISEFYTLSLNEKANLRRDLVGWRGRSFTGE